MRCPLTVHSLCYLHFLDSPLCTMVVVVVVVLEVVTVVWGPCNAEEVKNANMHLHECFVGLP